MMCTSCGVRVKRGWGGAELSLHWQPLDVATLLSQSLLRMAVLRSTAAQVQTVPGQQRGSSWGHRNTFFPMERVCHTL